MRPFEGIKIVDTTHVLAGPFASYQLALLGANVVKVENPNSLDQVREQGPDQEMSDANMGTYYLAQGANKKSITLDLKMPQGQKILKQLVVDSDIFIENYRAGSLEALGLGYSELNRLNDQLIYCSMTAFGQTGEKRRFTGYDMQIQATSGIMASTGTRDVNPIKVGPPIVDYATGTMAAFAISSALYQRSRTGKGQFIDQSMFDVSMMLMTADITNYLWSGIPPEPHGNDLALAGAKCYTTKEGLLMLGAMNRKQHTRLFRLLNRSDIAEQTNYTDRTKNAGEQNELLIDLFSKKTASEWEVYLQRHHIPAARVRSLPEALSDPQITERDLLHSFENFLDKKKSLSVPVSAFKFAHGGPKVDTPPPQPGEHTFEILSELGYSKSDFIDLQKAGVL